MLQNHEISAYKEILFRAILEIVRNRCVNEIETRFRLADGATAGRSAESYIGFGVT